MSVKPVSFRRKSSGYIYKKVEKPVKPERNYRSRCQKPECAYNEEMNNYKKELEYYNKHKGEYILSCSA